MQECFELIWWNKRRKPNVGLRLLSHVYKKIMLYDQNKRFQTQICPSIPMISVGNITVGGSGKTPFVVWLAGELKARGLNPVLLSRGDGANNQEPHVVSQYSKAREIGDEAVLLYRLSGCPVIAGRDRIKGAEMAAQYGDVLILDDGFQYRQLHRVCDIVLVPKEGVGNGCLLPAGPLREPISALARADIVVRTGQGDVVPLIDGKEWDWSAKAAGIVDWMGVWDMPLDSGETEAGKKVTLVTSVARPRRVRNDLEALGFDVSEHMIFDDHHAYTQENVAKLLKGHQTIVTTGKDAVKLLPLWDNSTPLWVLEQQAETEEGLASSICGFVDK
ncbi:MAG: tetraacyldisaccharide 4'-kinase [Ghiorsea sp.]|nr:tetraacyldisaccharide 4'-kinase [Ghiorsea sp.]